MNSGSPAISVLFRLVPPMTDQGDRGFTFVVTSSCRASVRRSADPCRAGSGSAGPSRRAETRALRSAAPLPPVCSASCVKVSTSHSVIARTVAVRGVSSKKPISPIIVPGPKRRTRASGPRSYTTRTSACPRARNSTSCDASPCDISVAPGGTIDETNDGRGSLPRPARVPSRGRARTPAASVPFQLRRRVRRPAEALRPEAGPRGSD